MEFRDRSAVVTGGGAGIGRALALAVGREGARVLVGDVREEAAAEVAEEIRKAGGEASSIVCDISQRESAARLATEVRSRFGSLDLLFANAGVGAAGAVADISERNWKWVLGVNLEGTLHTLQQLLPLIARPGGHVTITASMAGITAPGPNMAIYAASKAFLVSLGEGLHAELRPDGVGVHLLCPGLVATRIWDGARARPERFGGAVSLPEEIGEHWKTGLDPADVARRALAGIRASQLYILVPQGEAEAELHARHEAMASALEESGDA